MASCEIARDKVRAQMLLGKYKSVLSSIRFKGLEGQKVNGTDTEKQQNNEKIGLSKKERKKLKKKNKKIEKSQKKKEEEKFILNLVNFDKKKIRILNLPRSEILTSKWSSYILRFKRSNSRPAVTKQSENNLKRQSKSVSCTLL